MRSSPDKVKEQNRRYYLANQEKLKQAAKEYRSKNAEAVRAQDRARYVARRDEALEYHRERHARDAEAIKARKRAHYAANRDRMLEVARQRRETTPEFFRAMNARRKAALRRAVPVWSGELDALVWLEAADLVDLRAAATGFPWNADHMIALACRKASGLHVWNNCQVIPAAMNNAKKNKFVLTEPGEWISHLHQNF